MSGGGKIIEKHPMNIVAGTYPGKPTDVIRYRVMSEYRPGWFDEEFVMALPQEDEPQLGDTIWWGGGQVIFCGSNDSNRLTKVGYSWSADSEEVA